MKLAKCVLKGESPYSQSRYYSHSVPKKAKELPADYEERTWRERCHYDKKSGEIFIPVKQLTAAIQEAAKYLSLQIPGKGKSTYTKHFKAGIGIWDTTPEGNNGYLIGALKDEVESENCFVSPQGQNRRVMKTFPVIQNWQITIKVLILDDIITSDIFEQVLRTAGTLIGIGRYRPINGGLYGRFSVKSIEWEEKEGTYVTSN